VVYALRVQRIEADVRAAQLMAAVVAMSGGDATYPSLDEALAEFDAELLAPLPAPSTGADRQLRQALGVRAA
jgi:hypothetical protein